MLILLEDLLEEKYDHGKQDLFEDL